MECDVDKMAASPPAPGLTPALSKGEGGRGEGEGTEQSVKRFLNDLV